MHILGHGDRRGVWRGTQYNIMFTIKATDPNVCSVNECPPCL